MHPPPWGKMPQLRLFHLDDGERRMDHGEVNVQPPQIGTNTPAAEQAYAVHRVDLPTYCPVPGSSLWNGHPRVYIQLEHAGDEARCIYCGARFRLVD
jgi:uncharacterized Zn-finger protein